MRFIFIDAENIGTKGVEAITASASDKVLVFSKSEAVKDICERKLFLYISSYPSGSNQADFYIIGNLAGMIASLTEPQRNACKFILYSQDKSLVSAFSFQCQLHKVKHTVALEPKIKSPQKSKSIAPRKSQKSLEQIVYECFSTEQTTEHVRKTLKQPKSDFTKVINALIKTNKIERVSKAKKTWIKVDTV